MLFSRLLAGVCIMVCLVLPVSAQDKLVLPIEPLPEPDLPLARLGWMLFNDPGLSSDGTISCHSCHRFASYGADVTPVSYGVGGAAGRRNSPTVFNTSLNYRFFWDGRANSLKSQVDGPVHHPDEMNTDWEKVGSYLRASALYPDMFRSAGLKAINTDTIKYALVYFMSQLQTPGAPFDRYLLGDEQAISEDAKKGWQAFQELGCVYCHQGRNIGGQLMQRVGYYGRLSDQPQDRGRYEITGREQDDLVFRVPALRNVAKTAPYFHDGQVNDLHEVMRLMATLQLGIQVDEETSAHLVAFLESLTAPPPVILEVLADEAR